MDHILIKNPKDAYSMILESIDIGIYKTGERLVESELANRFGFSRTPIREALQRLETQGVLRREGRSLMVASLDHNEMSELYIVRAELEGLAAQLAAQHATQEEIDVLQDMVKKDHSHLDAPTALARSNKLFHRQLHLASHNRFLGQQLELVYRSMAILDVTSLAVEGRGIAALEEHQSIIDAIAARDPKAANDAVRKHLSKAYIARLQKGLAS